VQCAAAPASACRRRCSSRHTKQKEAALWRACQILPLPVFALGFNSKATWFGGLNENRSRQNLTCCELFVAAHHFELPESVVRVVELRAHQVQRVQQETLRRDAVPGGGGVRGVGASCSASVKGLGLRAADGVGVGQAHPRREQTCRKMPRISR
jgi:hypothetical protein